MPNLGYRTSRIVTQSGYEYRDAARTVAFVSHFRVVDSFELTSAFLDRALDVLLRHRLGLGGVDRRSQSRIVVGVAATELGGHSDLTNELRELRTALGVGRRLVMLDLLPLTMTGHNQIG